MRTVKRKISTNDQVTSCNFVRFQINLRAFEIPNITLKLLQSDFSTFCLFAEDRIMEFNANICSLVQTRHRNAIEVCDSKEEDSERMIATSINFTSV